MVVLAVAAAVQNCSATLFVGLRGELELKVDGLHFVLFRVKSHLQREESSVGAFPVDLFY